MMVLFMEFFLGRTQTVSFKLELACLPKDLAKVRDLLLGEEEAAHEDSGEAGSLHPI